jgi:hypothetical protein
LKNDDFETHGQVLEFINAQYGKSYSQSGIHRLFKRLGVKLKTVRPINYKQNKGALDYWVVLQTVCSVLGSIMFMNISLNNAKMHVVFFRITDGLTA